MDSDLWHACAGPLVRLPPINSVVYYFPQGHAEAAGSPIKFTGPTPHAVRCHLTNVEFKAHPVTDEPYANLTLSPIPDSLGHVTDNCDEERDSDVSSQPCSKVLTQSDANNGGGFSVPKLCADRVFPELDYAADPPVQTLLPRDLHGGEWKFRHIFRGTPRRHLLTSGWSTFVNAKKLVAGDCILFIRLSGGGMGVGVRRGRPVRRQRVTADDVAAAARLAAEGKVFEVVYEPCSGAEEFVVRAEKFEGLLPKKSAFVPGAKVAMEFEDYSDMSSKKRLVGTLCSFQPQDPVFFPTSPWRMLKVMWDAQQTEENNHDKKINVSLVNPWSISFQSTQNPIPVFNPLLALTLVEKPKFIAPRVDQSKESEPSEDIEFVNAVSQRKPVWLFGVNIAAPPPPKSDVPFLRCVFPKKKKTEKKKKDKSAVNRIASILRVIKERKNMKKSDDKINLELTLGRP